MFWLPAIEKITKNPDIIAKIGQVGLPMAYMSPDKVLARMHEEYKNIEDLGKKFGSAENRRRNAQESDQQPVLVGFSVFVSAEGFHMKLWVSQRPGPGFFPFLAGRSWEFSPLSNLVGSF